MIPIYPIFSLLKGDYIYLFVAVGALRKVVVLLFHGLLCV